MSETYEDIIYNKGFSCFSHGETTEGYDTVEDLRKIFPSGSIIDAFLNDDDIQQITVSSTNIGFSRTYTKIFKKTQGVKKWGS